MAEPIINDPTREVGYALQRNGLLLAGKQAAEAIGYFVESAVPSLTPEVANIATSAAGGLTGIGGMVTIGLAAGVSAALTQLDYIHRKDNIANLYKEELAARFNKPVNQVKSSDLDALAKTNDTIDEEMKRNKRQRNFGLGLSFIASMSALAISRLAVPAALTAMGATLPGLAVMAATAAVSVVMYNVIKEPLHFLADKMFGIDEKTTNDYIVSLKRDRDMGKDITREQVLSVFIAANPEVGRQIIAEFGKSFDALPPETQQKVAAEVSAVLPLDRMAQDINSGKMRVMELAFAVEGQSSGASGPAAPEHKKGLLSELFQGMVKVDVHVPGAKAIKHMAQTVRHTIAEPTHIMQMMSVTQERHGDAPPTTKKSFVTRLGFSKKDPQVTHVQQLEQGSDTSALIGPP